MNIGTVSAASIAGMAFSLIVSVGLPVALFIYVWKKLGARVSSFFIGCAVFYLVARVIEPMVHSFMLSATGDKITGNIVLLAIYGGLVAAVFEEGGRLIAMKSFIKELDLDNAFMYGAGHGGFEAILLIATTMFSNILNSLLINNGWMAESLASLDAETALSTFNTISLLWTTPSIDFFFSGIERALAMTLHICLSILVFWSIRRNNKRYLLMAYAGHFLVDAVAVLTQGYATVAVTELVTAIMTGALVMLTVRICKEENASDDAGAPPMDFHFNPDV